MDKKKFIWIILLGKPWCILAYSYAAGLILGGYYEKGIVRIL